MPESTLYDDDVERVYVSLYHNHIPKLVDDGIVVFDEPTESIHAVAEAEGVSPGDIKQPPLFEVVDTTALEAALFGNGNGVRASPCLTEFMYRGYRIVVKTDGWVLVHEQVGP